MLKSHLSSEIVKSAKMRKTSLHEKFAENVHSAVLAVVKKPFCTNDGW
jgi:hypothetical protein